MTAPMTDGEAFAMLQRLAGVLSDGHFTVMKFTTNWRVVFGSQSHALHAVASEGQGLDEAIASLPVGTTLADAIWAALERRIMSEWES